MLIAARNAMMSGGGWKNPYVTDGLIAMWDGEWNAGGGVHDASATTWKDLVGSYDMELTSLGSFGDNKLINAAGGIGASCNGSIDTVGSTEVVLKASAWYKYATTYYTCLGKTRFFGQRNAITNGNNRMGDGNYGQVEDGNLGIDVLRSWSIHRPIGLKGSFYVNGEEVSCRFYSVQGLEAIPISVNAATYQTDFYCIRAYNRELSSSEITANYAVDKVRFNLP